MIALSVRGPWWWFILHSGKRFENRRWGGRYLTLQMGVLRRAGSICYLHASSGCTIGEYEAACSFAADRGVRRFPEFRSMHRGGLVGIMHIKEFVHGSSDPWFMGPGALEIDRVIPIEFSALGGALGFFEVPPAKRQEITLEQAWGNTVEDFHVSRNPRLEVFHNQYQCEFFDGDKS